jgi:hypothetical protein
MREAFDDVESNRAPGCRRSRRTIDWTAAAVRDDQPANDG